MSWRRVWWWILASVKVLVTKMPYMNRSFIILSSARSGSTLLLQLLNTHNEIDCRRELLNREVLKEHRLKDADAGTLMNYVRAKLLPLKLWLSYTGFKVFNEQLEYCNLPLQRVIKDLQSPPVIVLYRQNLLETYVSLKIAFHTNVWYSGEMVNDCRVQVDWDDFYEYAESERKRWKKSMSALEGVKTIIITYDHLAGSQQKETMYQLFNFLNLNVNAHGPLISDCVKQNPLHLEEKVVNYHEIVEKAEALGYTMALTLN